jgi:hypothetical protein
MRDQKLLLDFLCARHEEITTSRTVQVNNTSQPKSSSIEKSRKKILNYCRHRTLGSSTKWNLSLIKLNLVERSMSYATCKTVFSTIQYPKVRLPSNRRPRSTLLKLKTLSSDDSSRSWKKSHRLKSSRRPRGWLGWLTRAMPWSNVYNPKSLS